MNKCEVCGKEIKAPYKYCWTHSLVHKKAGNIVEDTIFDKSNTPSQKAEEQSSSALGSDHNDRILRGQCLNIAAQYFNNGDITFNSDKILDLAEKFYNKVKERRYL